MSSSIPGTFLAYRKRVSKFLESPQNKAFTMMGLTFGALSIFGAFAIRPTISTIITLNKTLEEGRMVEEKMTEKIDALNSLQQQTLIHERKIDLCKLALPQSEQLDYVVADLELVAKKYNLTLTSIEPPDKENSAVVLDVALNDLENLATMKIKARLEGSSSSFADFVNHLENLPRQIYVTKLDTLNDEDMDQDKLSHSVEFIVFYTSLSANE